MIINTADFERMPRLASAVLNESVDDAATLELEWLGFLPEWVGWMEPVTLMHRGRVLFHGRVTSFVNNNAANDKTSSATVTNALWLLDHLTVGAQIAEWQAAQQASSGGNVGVDGKDYVVGGYSLSRAGAAAMRSWAALAESCRVEAPGWVVDEEGKPREDGQLWLDVSEANYSAGVPYNHRGAITAWTAMLDMKRANPDAVFVPDYVTGAIRVVSIGGAEQMTWDTRDVRMADISGVGPQYEECITGVLLMISWEDAEGKTGSVAMKYPEEVSESADRVKLFTYTSDSEQHARRQLDYIGEQLRRYYEAANMLQWGGSLTVLMPDVEGSPLGKRLNLQGVGAHESWREMGAVVSAVSWDFMEGTVEVTLGRTFAEPDLVELEFEDEGDTTDDGLGGDGDEDETTEEGGGWEFPDETTDEDEATDGGVDVPGGELMVTLDEAVAELESFDTTVKLTVAAHVQRDGVDYENVEYEWRCEPEANEIARQDDTLVATWFGFTGDEIRYTLKVKDKETGGEAETSGVWTREGVAGGTGTGMGTGTGTGTGTRTGTQGTQGGGGGGEISEAQKKWNLMVYVQLIGYDFGHSTYAYLNPSVFPDWLEGASVEEVERRLTQEFERPDRNTPNS